MMVEDATEEDGQPKAFADASAGEVLEQRIYVTTESANEVIEVVILPGS